MTFTFPDLVIVFSFKVGCLHKSSLQVSMFSQRSKITIPKLQLSRSLLHITILSNIWKEQMMSWWKDRTRHTVDVSSAQTRLHVQSPVKANVIQNDLAGAAGADIDMSKAMCQKPDCLADWWGGHLAGCYQQWAWGAGTTRETELRKGM